MIKMLFNLWYLSSELQWNPRGRFEADIKTGPCVTELQRKSVNREAKDSRCRREIS